MFASDALSLGLDDDVDQPRAQGAFVLLLVLVHASFPVVQRGVVATLNVW